MRREVVATVGVILWDCIWGGGRVSVSGTAGIPVQCIRGMKAERVML